MLETHIGTVRRTLTGRYQEAHAHVQGLISRWIGVENRVEHRIKSLLPPDERLVPGVLYVAIAFLSGSVVARHRALPIRALLPPTLGIAAAVRFLPKTSSNVREYVGALEDHYTPEVARVHETGKAHSAMAWARVSESAAGARETVRGGVLAAVAQVQGATGLRLGEALGVARDMEEKAEKIVEEAVAQLEGAVDKGEKKA